MYIGKEEKRRLTSPDRKEGQPVAPRRAVSTRNCSWQKNKMKTTQNPAPPSCHHPLFLSHQFAQRWFCYLIICHLKFTFDLRFGTDRPARHSLPISGKKSRKKKNKNKNKFKKKNKNKKKNKKKNTQTECTTQKKTSEIKGDFASEFGSAKNTKKTEIRRDLPWNLGPQYIYIQNSRLSCRKGSPHPRVLTKSGRLCEKLRMHKTHRAFRARERWMR